MKDQFRTTLRFLITLILLSGTGHFFFNYPPLWQITGLQAPFSMFTSSIGIGEHSPLKLYDVEKNLRLPLQFPGSNFISNVLIPYKSFLITQIPSEKKNHTKAFAIVNKAICRKENLHKKFKLNLVLNGGVVERHIDCTK